MCSTVIPPHAHTQEMPCHAHTQEKLVMQTFRRYHHLHTLIQPSLSSPPLSLLSHPSSLKPQSTETCEEGQYEKDEGGGSTKGGMRVFRLLPYVCE